MKKLIVIMVINLAIAGCGSVNNALVEKKKNVEYYRIFDIKTNADRNVVAEAASNGLGRNVSSANESIPIPNFSEPPEKPGRFKLDNPFSDDSKLSALATMGGSINVTFATCEGAVWTATANKNFGAGSNLKLIACLWQYKDGYHLDTYANFHKSEGGLMQISRSMASAMVGTPEEWTEKTFLDIVRSIRKVSGAEVHFVEGYPKLSGTPWLDKFDKL